MHVWLKGSLMILDSVLFYQKQSWNVCDNVSVTWTVHERTHPNSSSPSCIWRWDPMPYTDLQTHYKDTLPLTFIPKKLHSKKLACLSVRFSPSLLPSSCFILIRIKLRTLNVLCTCFTIDWHPEPSSKKEKKTFPQTASEHYTHLRLKVELLQLKQGYGVQDPGV